MTNDNTIPQLPIGAANILLEDILKQKGEVLNTETKDESPSTNNSN
jgi:hypothetical protein